MAQALKDRYGPEVIERIAARLHAVDPSFPAARFVADARRGYAALELTARARHIACALQAHLPADYERAVDLLIASLGPPLTVTADFGMAGFDLLPYTYFVAAAGLDHFEASMRAQYEITQRFTAEFSLRAFLVREPDRTLARLAQWVDDPSPHVRRLVSEGTRPRLPWAPRLREFQRDPAPVLALLERLKDDPEDYVRRSVANHLNDIGKDHPQVLIETARRWWQDGDARRRALVRHALRAALRRGDREALAILGFGAGRIEVLELRVAPRRPVHGSAVTIDVDLANRSAQPQRVLVDLRLHFVKASGRTGPRVFRLRTLELGPGARLQLSKRLQLVDLSTRRLHPGRHRVEVLVDGRAVAAGDFTLRAAPGAARR